MPRPITATIHPEAVRHNLGGYGKPSPDAKLWSVIKANAYGHGIENVFEGLRATDEFCHAWTSMRPSVAIWDSAAPSLLLERRVQVARPGNLLSRLGIWHTGALRRADRTGLAAHKTRSATVFL